MANLGVILKIMPKDPDVDLGALEGKIKSVAKVLKLEKKPIAFGLNALITFFEWPEFHNSTP